MKISPQSSTIIVRNSIGNNSNFPGLHEPQKLTNVLVGSSFNTPRSNLVKILKSIEKNIKLDEIIASLFIDSKLFYINNLSFRGSLAFQ